jgi:hypothetical protein
MALVANEYTTWRGPSGSDSDMGRLVVWAEDTGQRQIDRVEIDNRACTGTVWVYVQDNNGADMMSHVVAPGVLYTDIGARGQRWTRNTQQKISQWYVSATVWQ